MANTKKELEPTVKHLIKYLQDNFDEDAPIMLDSGWGLDYDAKDEIELIENSGVFQKWKQYLFIQN